MKSSMHENTRKSISCAWSDLGTERWVSVERIRYASSFATQSRVGNTGGSEAMECLTAD